VTGVQTCALPILKKYFMMILAAVICLVFVGTALTENRDDIQAHKTCGLCGMDREKFDSSRMLLEYDDGSVVAVCSIHCAAIDMANKLDKTPKSIKVADFKGKTLINAEKAFWVVGGNRPGVMSKQGKWAFEKKDDAEKFLMTNQGKLTSYEEALNETYKNMSEDTQMIRNKRAMKRMKQMADQKAQLDN
jgi:copper chaperone NosL